VPAAWEVRATQTVAARAIQARAVVAVRPAVRAVQTVVARATWAGPEHREEPAVVQEMLAARSAVVRAARAVRRV
jgi:hypothetical protein